MLLNVTKKYNRCIREGDIAVYAKDVIAVYANVKIYYRCIREKKIF